MRRSAADYFARSWPPDSYQFNRWALPPPKRQSPAPLAGGNRANWEHHDDVTTDSAPQPALQASKRSPVIAHLKRRFGLRRQVALVIAEATGLGEASS